MSAGGEALCEEWRRRGLTRRWVESDRNEDALRRHRLAGRRGQHPWRKLLVRRRSRGRQLEGHVLGELLLVRASTTDPDSTALAGRDRRSVGEGGGGMAAVPSDVQGARLGAVLEASGLESAFDIAGVEPVAVDRTTGCGVRYE